MAQMDQVISEASIAQMQTATVLIEKQYASEDAQLIQDAQVVFNQIEQNRKMQHLLTEKRKNELLMAVYNDFLQWVHQMTSEDMKMKLNRSESSLSTTTTKDTTFQNEQNPTTSSPNSVSIKVQDRADNDEHSEVSDTGSRSNGSIRSMEPMETEEDEDEWSNHVIEYQWLHIMALFSLTIWLL